MKTIGLILCGGRSSRMGKDKAFIAYHGKPQWQHLSEMLQPLCDQVILSCNANQASLLGHQVEYVVDDPKYNHAGPLTGLLSTWDKFPEHSVILVGCDYPGLLQTDITHLLSFQPSTWDAICYQNPDSGIDEPLIAWYSVHAHTILKEAYLKGESSLRKLLSAMNTLRKIADDPSRLFSVDTPEKMNGFISES